MTKYGVEILKVLSDNEITIASKSMSVGNVLAKIPETRRKSYTTTYRHLTDMVKLGYVKAGLDDERASTYFMTSPGTIFYKSQINN